MKYDNYEVEGWQQFIFNKIVLLNCIREVILIVLNRITRNLRTKVSKKPYMVTNYSWIKWNDKISFEGIFEHHHPSSISACFRNDWIDYFASLIVGVDVELFLPDDNNLFPLISTWAAGDSMCSCGTST